MWRYLTTFSQAARRLLAEYSPSLHPLKMFSTIAASAAPFNLACTPLAAPSSSTNTLSSKMTVPSASFSSS